MDCPLWRLASATRHLGATPLSFALEHPECDAAIVAALLQGGAELRVAARWAGPPQGFAATFPGTAATLPHVQVVPAALLRACWGEAGEAHDAVAAGEVRRALAPRLGDRSADGETALHWAARGLRVATCRWFLAAAAAEGCAGGVAGAADSAGRTPLHALCSTSAGGGAKAMAVVPWAACACVIVAAAVEPWLARDDAGMEPVHRLHPALSREPDSSSGAAAGSGGEGGQSGAALLRVVIAVSLGADAGSAPTRRQSRSGSTVAVLRRRVGPYWLRLSQAAWCVSAAPRRLGVTLPRCLTQAVGLALQPVEPGRTDDGGGNDVRVVRMSPAGRRPPFVPAHTDDECNCSDGDTAAGAGGVWLVVPAQRGVMWVAAAAAWHRRAAAIGAWRAGFWLD